MPRLFNEEMQIYRCDRETTCARCDQYIDFLEFFVIAQSPDPRGDPRKTLRSQYALDLQCALDRNPAAFAKALMSAPPEFPEKSPYHTLVEARLKAIEHRAGTRVKHVQRSMGAPPEVVFPKVTSDEAPAILPARDPLNRPRVKVLCTGSACHPTDSVGVTFWDALHADTWTSPKRQYEFVRMDDPFALPEEDPSQPVVATLFMSTVDRAEKLGQERTLLLWAALGFPPPVLWLQSLQSRPPKESRGILLREQLRERGHQADDCPMLLSSDVSPESLDALVERLDESVPTIVECRQTEDACYAGAQMLLRQLRGGEIEHWKALLQPLAALCCEAYSARTEELLIELTKQLMEKNLLELAATFLTRGAVRRTDPMIRWILAALSEEGPWLRPELYNVCWFLAKSGGAVPTHAVLERFRKERSSPGIVSNVHILAPVIIHFGTKTELETLRGMVDPKHILTDGYRQLIDRVLEQGALPNRAVPNPKRPDGYIT